MKIKSPGLTLAAAAATALAPFGALTILALTPLAPVAQACPGLVDDAGNNISAAHNACCGDAQISGRSEPNCNYLGVVPAAPQPLPPRTGG